MLIEVVPSKEGVGRGAEQQEERMQDIYQVFFKLKFRIMQMHCVFIFLSLLLNLLQYCCFCFIVCLFFLA